MGSSLWGRLPAVGGLHKGAAQESNQAMMAPYVEEAAFGALSSNGENSGSRLMLHLAGCCGLGQEVPQQIQQRCVHSQLNKLQDAITEEWRSTKCSPVVHALPLARQVRG